MEEKQAGVQEKLKALKSLTREGITGVLSTTIEMDPLGLALGRGRPMKVASAMNK